MSIKFRNLTSYYPPPLSTASSNWARANNVKLRTSSRSRRRQEQQQHLHHHRRRLFRVSFQFSDISPAVHQSKCISRCLIVSCPLVAPSPPVADSKPSVCASFVVGIRATRCWNCRRISSSEKVDHKTKGGGGTTATTNVECGLTLRWCIIDEPMKGTGQRIDGASTKNDQQKQLSADPTQ